MNPTPKLLALDLASTVGWANYANGIIDSGSQAFKAKDGTHQGERYAQFHRWLSEKIRTDKPAQIAYEEAMGFFKSASAAQIAYGFRGILMSLAAAHNIPCYGYVAPTVKKFWTGSGRADKDDMIAATLLKLPDVDLSDANQADALAILHLHLSKL